MERDFASDAEWQAYELGYEDALAEHNVSVNATIRAAGGIPRYGNQLLVCTLDGCMDLQHSRGWCKRHYERWLDGRKVDAPDRPAPVKGCTATDCSRGHRARGLCFTHYKNWKRALKRSEEAGANYLRTIHAARESEGVEVSAV